MKIINATTISSLPSNGTVFVNDGTDISQISINNLKSSANIGDNLVTDNAGFHNSIYRGKNLTSVYSVAEICNRITAGTFKDLYIGDYFTISITTSLGGTETVDCMLAGFDLFLNNGDTALTKHHAVIVPRNSFKTSAQMNAENTTTGGYYNSKMHQETLPIYYTALQTATGNHVLTFRAILTNSVSGGVPNGWDYYDTNLVLLNETMLYGTKVWANSGYEVGIFTTQLPLFRLNHAMKNPQRSWFWLQGVYSSSDFCVCLDGGTASIRGASHSVGVRPLFLLG